jgi:hypothetical protein
MKLFFLCARGFGPQAVALVTVAQGKPCVVSRVIEPQDDLHVVEFVFNAKLNGCGRTFEGQRLAGARCPTTGRTKKLSGARVLNKYLHKRGTFSDAAPFEATPCAILARSAGCGRQNEVG